MAHISFVSLILAADLWLCAWLEINLSMVRFKRLLRILKNSKELGIVVAVVAWMLHTDCRWVDLTGIPTRANVCLYVYIRVHSVEQVIPQFGPVWKQF